MPSRNVLKLDEPQTYYHVYARGNSRTEIFLDQDDHIVFLKLFERYLSEKPKFDKYGTPYPHLYQKLELVCYCQMPNHFHLLIYQEEQGAMSQFMRGLMTSYSRYFNKKYGRSGSLFETRYKASLIYDQTYLEHITRYIHLNPKCWKQYEHSSLPFYLGQNHTEWLRPEKILTLFKDSNDYLSFLEDYEENKRILNQLKYELANDIGT